MENRYYCHNRRKFNLKVHVVLVTKYRRRLFQNGVETTLKGCCQSIADIYGWKIIAMETDIDHIHILLEYDTTETVSSIVHKLKQRTTHALWGCYPQKMRRCFWKRKNSGLMDSLRAVLEKHLLQSSRNTSIVRGN